MKNRTIALVFAILALCSAGVSAVVTLAHEDAQNSRQTTEKDRLIGVYVTKEYVSLVDMEQYIQDNIDAVMNGDNILTPEDTAAYTDRLYATEKIADAVNPYTGESYTTHDLEFPGVEGFGSYCYTSEENGTPVNVSGGLGAISDRHLGLTTTDYGEQMEMTGTLYTSDTFDSVLYFNPLYQSADGSIYLLPGSGIYHSGMGLSSYTLSEENTAERDGKTVITTSSKITINMEGVIPPEKIVILQFSEDHEILAETEYTQDTFPQILTLLPDTEYFITESHTPRGETKITRELHQKEDEYMDIFCPREDGICIKESIKLEWN